MYDAPSRPVPMRNHVHVLRRPKLPVNPNLARLVSHGSPAGAPAPPVVNPKRPPGDHT